MHPDTLNASFGLPGSLAFDQPHPGLIRARITTPACQGELYLHGAHITSWQPAGERPVLFLSERSAFAPGKPIRGGVPVIFPWFGAPETSPVHPPSGSPMHGFARTTDWTVTFAALAGDDLHLNLALAPDERTRELGFGSFQLAYEIVFGRELRLRLSVLNTGAEPFLFEEALHTYFAVGDARKATLTGLAATDFLDKTEGFARKSQTDPVLAFDRETDRPYLNTAAATELHDPAQSRTITVSKSGSQTTVVWNPWAERAAQLPDLQPDAWQDFVCIETANAAENVVQLHPQEAHTMEARFTVASV